MLLSNPFRPDPRVLKEAIGLQKANFQVIIICWDRAAELPQEETHPSGFRIIRIQRVPSSYGIGKKQLHRIPRFWFAVWPHLVVLKPSIIHCHDFDTLPVGLAWGRLHTAPVIYDAHEYYAELVRPRLQGLSGKMMYYGIRFSELLCAKFASAIITVDDMLAKIYQKQNRLTIIIGHYPSKIFYQPAAPIFSRNELHLLYIGRISQDRGMLVYIDILRHLLKAGINARLIMAGIFTPAEEEVLFKSNLNTLANHVEITGWIPYEDMPSLLNNCDIGLVILQPEPRYFDALPVKLFEYMAAGLPVIASKFPALSQVIENHECGLLVEPDLPPSKIAEHIISWSVSPSIPKKLGENGFLAIQSIYNWETLVGKLINLYKDLLEKGY